MASPKANHSEEPSSRIIDTMMAGDEFSQWLGITRLEERPGFIRLTMTVRPEMVNGFRIAHGGITYSLADSALAFASNSHGRHALSIDTNIQHLKPVMAGDQLFATAREKSLSHRIGHYEVEVHNQRDELVALFRGLVYRKEETW